MPALTRMNGGRGPLLGLALGCSWTELWPLPFAFGTAALAGAFAVNFAPAFALFFGANP